MLYFAIFTILITPFGLKSKDHTSLIDNIITLEDLFRP